MRRVIGIVFLLAVGPVQATTIDFTVFANGDTGSTTLVTPEATFNSFGGNFFVGAAGIGSEICALGGGCATDFEAIFMIVASAYAVSLTGTPNSAMILLVS